MPANNQMSHPGQVVGRNNTKGPMKTKHIFHFFQKILTTLEIQKSIKSLSYLQSSVDPCPLIRGRDLPTRDEVAAWHEKEIRNSS